MWLKGLSIEYSFASDNTEISVFFSSIDLFYNLNSYSLIIFGLFCWLAISLTSLPSARYIGTFSTVSFRQGAGTRRGMLHAGTHEIGVS